MKTEFLTDWEVLAVEKAVAFFLARGQIEPRSAEALLHKISKASHIRLTIPEQKPSRPHSLGVITS